MTQRYCIVCNEPLPIIKHSTRKFCDKHQTKLPTTGARGRGIALTAKAIYGMDGIEPVPVQAVTVPTWMIVQDVHR